jgi:hypothetical protein
VNDPVEDYLDQLYTELRWSAAAGRRMLREAEEHLRDAIAEERARGLSDEHAAARALDRFGSARQVARSRTLRPRRARPLDLWIDLARAAWLLTGTGLLAIGLSGVVAAGMNAAFGRDFVGGTPAGTTWNAGDCRHLLAVQPAARDCARAAVLENSADAVSLRMLAGGVGLLLFLAYLLANRRRVTSGNRVLPAAFVPAVASVVFGAAGIALAGMAADAALVNHLRGAGFSLSGAIAAAVVTGCCLRPLWRAAPFPSLRDLATAARSHGTHM